MRARVKSVEQTSGTETDTDTANASSLNGGNPRTRLAQLCAYLRRPVLVRVKKKFLHFYQG
ncbi:MAG: hypothetical protein RMY34_30490 [Aulosira sp. DedQUE10]|nr:hypothetical protein [Aulosira sp. DedQUE10]